MKGQTHFKLESVENVQATLTITASVAEWRLLIEGAELYKGGSEEWYRWIANTVLSNFYGEIRSLLQQVERAQLTAAHRTSAVLDDSFQATERGVGD